ncbi:MAG: mechanosensitive ion channel family protein [Candidatus Kariarchaeaceae archaeon]|jgi:serine acetyltransferase
MANIIDSLDENVKFVIFFVIVILTFIFQRVLQLFVKKAASRERIPPDVVNGIRVLIRFAGAIIILYSAVILLDIGKNATLSLSVFLGSIVSFASMHTIQNFVAGLYIIITRPFKVNDFVKIGSSEGVVTEISLNYTTILNFEGILEYIPNKRILGSIIINYDQKVKEDASDQERLSWSEKLKQVSEEHEITRYSFIWGAPLIDYNEMKKRIDNVCKKYKNVFGYLPEYMPYTINHRFEFYFILRSNAPITILRNKTNFLDDVSAQFH